VPGLLGSHSPTFAPYGSFRTAAGSLVLAGAGSEALWHKLCDALDAPELAEDPRFADNALRVANRDTLTLAIEARLSTADAESWLRRLAAVGVPSSVVRSVPEALTSALADAVGSVRTHVSGKAEYGAVAPPFTIDGPLDYPRGAPTLGEHTGEVLAALGFSATDIDGLLASGVVK
jgi:crotonobetainyl-CoA:carnitine CoA-transferase CaiB-like acyl-CoA transferase